MFLSKLVHRSSSVCVAGLRVVLFFALQSGQLAAEHTVYIPPVFVRGDFFNQWLEPEDRVGVSARCRHEQTLDSRTLGRFLGPDGKADFTIGPRYQYDLFTGLVMHEGAAAPDSEQQSVILAPSNNVQKVDVTLWGNITPQQWQRSKQLSFFANFDFAAVEQQLNARWQPIMNKRVGLESDYQDFFEGRYNNDLVAGTEKQTNLLYEKFNNAVLRDAGISSLTLGVAFQREFEQLVLMSMQGLCSIPCGNKSDGGYLFKPRRGMGCHWGIGLGIDLAVPLSKRLRATVSVSDMFWLPAYDVRTAGIKFRPFSYYLGLGKQGQQNEPVIPAANVLTQDCLVKPGNAVIMKFGLEGVFAQGHRVFGAWHGMYKEAEKVSFRTMLSTGTYAVAAATYPTNQLFTPLVGVPPDYRFFDFIDPVFNDLGDAAWLQPKDLDFTVSAMPSYFENAFELGWESLRAFKAGQMEGGPHVVLGYRAMQGENASILPNIFTCEIGVGVKF